MMQPNLFGDAEDVLGLTLWRPWGLAFIWPRDATMHDPPKRKDVENRPWKPWSTAIGKLVALHHGQKWDDRGADAIEEILGVRVTEKDAPPGQVIALGRLIGSTTTSSSPWFFGPYGWLFENLRPVEPMLMGGKQGLWPVDKLAAQELIRRWRDMRDIWR